LPQFGKQYWRRLETGLFLAEAVDGRQFLLESFESRAPGQPVFWVLHGAGRLTVLDTPYRDKAMQAALRQLETVALRVLYPVAP
jgi:hypothetical protein